MRSMRVKTILIFLVLVVLLSATAFAQSEKRVYGRSGVWNLGFNFWGAYERLNDNLVLNGMPANNTGNVFKLEVDAFAKYFPLDRFHLGAKLSYRTDLEYGASGLTDGSHMVSLLASGGYTIALSPRFQIDLGLFAGGRADFVVYPSFYFLFAPMVSGEVMLLFPVIENVLIGFGYDFTVLFWPPQSIVDYSVSLGYRNGTVQGLSLEHGAKFQVSFYF
jgi:hypothetical protein